MSVPTTWTTDDDRGQTLPDFAIGMAVFLIAVLVLVVLIPQIVLPYDGQDRAVITDRFTNELAGDHLVASEPVGQLNESATKDFFDDDINAIREEFGLPGWYSVNVTLRDQPTYTGDSTVLCPANGASEWLSDDCTDDERLAVGEEPPADSDAVSVGRVVLHTPDRTVVLEVRGW